MTYLLQQSIVRVLALKYFLLTVVAFIELIFIILYKMCNLIL